MFRVECFCEDKNLPKVLLAIAGVAVGQPTVQPVVNAVAKNGAIAAASSGDVVEMLVSWLKKTGKGKTGFRPVEVREFCQSVGRSEGSYTYVLNQAREAKAIKKAGGGKTNPIYKLATAQ